MKLLRFRRRVIRRWRGAMATLAVAVQLCCAPTSDALSLIPIEERIRDFDYVVVGQLRVTRRNSIVIRWLPDRRSRDKGQTTTFHEGTISVSQVLYVRDEHDRLDADVMFPSGTPLPKGTAAWGLLWNSAVGRNHLQWIHGYSLAEVERAVRLAKKKRHSR